jgi:putative pyrroloquinoline-quinone binding quinoprotein
MKRGRILFVGALLPLVLLGWVPPALAVPGDSLWSKTIAGSGSGDDSAFDVEVSPDGTRAFVTGWVISSTGGYDLLTGAYDTASGTKLWQKRYDGPVHGLDQSMDLALLGSRVFVTGTSKRGGAAGDDIVTFAYDAATGARLWMNRYNSPANDDDSGWSVDAVTGHVVVIGQSGIKIITLSLSPRTGAVQWVRRTKKWGEPSVVVARGSRAYVVGRTISSGYSDAWATAYRTDTGAAVWTRTWKAAAANVHDGFDDAALSSDGAHLYALGTTGKTMLLQALNAASGAIRWTRRPAPQVDGNDQGQGVAVAPNGSAVFITGESRDSFSDETYLTMAYDSDGGSLWTAREQAFEDGGSTRDIATSPDGTEVWVTGAGWISISSYVGPLTVAYDAAVVAPSLWRHYTESLTPYGSSANAVAAAPDGSAVYIAGQLESDIFIEAYEV